MDAGVLDEASLRAALLEQRRWGGQLGRILVDMSLIDEKTLVSALSHQLNFPVADLSKLIDPQVLDLVPAELAEQNSLVPFNVQGKFLDVAMSDPTNLGIIDELRIRTQLNVRPYLAGPKVIEHALATYYGRGVSLDIGMSRPGTRPPEDGVPELDLEATSRPVAADRSFVSRLPTSPPIERQPSASAARAAMFELGPAGAKPGSSQRDAEIAALQQRISKLEALVSRDEDVLRKILSLLVEKGIASREEILERIK